MLKAWHGVKHPRSFKFQTLLLIIKSHLRKDLRLRRVRNADDGGETQPAEAHIYKKMVRLRPHSLHKRHGSVYYE